MQQMNAKCSCGSGLKFKRCCLSKGIGQRQTPTQHPAFNPNKTPRRAAISLFVLGAIAASVID